ncbi:TipAS antibiotic-recognition domain-containing protein [soil metagenome]
MTGNDNDWPIQSIARLAGTTSRTLRHYADIGLLTPSRIGENGYRYYDQAALARLQRILLLRELGLGLPAIRDVLDATVDPAAALGAHARWLCTERDRIDRQIRSVETTIRKMEREERLMPAEMFDGFDHTAHRGEVEERWGTDAYRRSDAWWKVLGGKGRDSFRAEQRSIADAYRKALDDDDDVDVESAEVQAIVARHFAWIAEAWGGKSPSAEQFEALGELYVADERFAAAYGGPDGARYVADSMAAYAARTL